VNSKSLRLISHIAQNILLTASFVKTKITSTAANLNLADAPRSTGTGDAHSRTENLALVVTRTTSFSGTLYVRLNAINIFTGNDEFYSGF